MLREDKMMSTEGRGRKSKSSVMTVTEIETTFLCKIEQNQSSSAARDLGVFIDCLVLFQYATSAVTGRCASYQPT